ncbi:MAG: class I SAM-dependent methyltransferase [Halioglobus sp.]
MNNLPFSQACENNKDAILAVLLEVFGDRQQVLEIGSGTGQHATYFASKLTHLLWQPTEVPQNLHIPRPRIAAYAGDNLLREQALDVWDEPWQVSIPDAVFSANTLHIMSFASVQRLFEVLGDAARETAGVDRILAVYGPFNYGGEYTSESNARFDRWLAEQHPDSAIRDFEAVNALAQQAGYTLLSDNEMPANNRLLVWKTA